MRLCNPILLCSVALVISAPVTAQQAAPRDPVAISLLQKAVAAMAFTLPADSAASGSVSWTEGSDKEDGTVRVLTRGTDQTAEEIVTSNGGRDVGYSRGQAAERKGERSFSVPMELAFVDQSADFPLPLLAGALSNPDFAFRYLGQETIDGKMALHIRF